MNSNFTLAIHSLTLLALQPDHMSSSDYIAESAGVHPVRIRKVLSILKKHGYITSKEGTGGGFIFTLNPEDVTLWDLYKVTSEGTLQPKCPQSNERCLVGANLQQVLFKIFLGAEEHLGEYLRNYTIKEIVNFVNREDRCM
ncbi:Rrf2 family transcriptional regulator [Neobacillus mesonae]|uniref:RrF2 family transcriptional regulator n=1 Tax=Neobacillus mesonae TaxID=1193713 RepID=UPI002E1BFDFF|nr:Rrf2 family transcriptional regulator [Neobacillus mesonae]